MALAPVALFSDPLEDYAANWVKFYAQGTTTPISMATDSGGGTTVAKAEVSSGGTVPIGFIKTAGDVIFIPYLDQAYDLYLFPTEAEADANDTSNAIQLADNVDPLLTIDDVVALPNLILPALQVNYEAGNNFNDGVDRTQEDKNIELMSVKDFGAVGDGVTDDFVAIQSAFDEASRVVYAKIIFPAGVYILGSKASISPGLDKFISVEGAGVGVTTIICPASNTDGAIQFNFAGRTSIISISNMTITTEADGGGTAIRVTQPVGGNRHNRSVYIENVEINVSDVTQNFWDKGINLTGCWRPYLKSVLVGGPFGPGVSSDLTDASPLYFMAIGMELDDTYHPEVHDCYIWSAATGISCTSSESPAPEAFRMSNTNIVGVKTALKWLRVDREPTIWISDCHINYRNNGFDIDGAKLVIITGCIPYNEDTGDEYGATPIDMVFDNVEHIIITDNIFHFNGNPNRINVGIDGDPFFVGALIADNIFNSEATRGISVGSTAANVTIARNQFPGNITDNIVDFSNTAIIADDLSMTSGTWTPQLTFGGGSTGLTTSSAVGDWRISGGLFHFNIQIVITAKGSSTGDADISLPATTDLPGTAAVVVDSGAVEWPIYSAMSGLTNTPSGRPNNSTSMRLLMHGTTIISNLTEANFTNTSNFNLSGTFRFS